MIILELNFPFTLQFVEWLTNMNYLTNVFPSLINNIGVGLL